MCIIAATSAHTASLCIQSATLQCRQFCLVLNSGKRMPHCKEKFATFLLLHICGFHTATHVKGTCMHGTSKNTVQWKIWRFTLHLHVCCEYLPLDFFFFGREPKTTHKAGILSSQQKRCPTRILTTQVDSITLHWQMCAQKYFELESKTYRLKLH